MFEKVQARQAGFINKASRMIPAGPEIEKAAIKRPSSDLFVLDGYEGIEMFCECQCRVVE